MEEGLEWGKDGWRMTRRWWQRQGQPGTAVQQRGICVCEWWLVSSKGGLGNLLDGKMMGRAMIFRREPAPPKLNLYKCALKTDKSQLTKRTEMKTKAFLANEVPPAPGMYRKVLPLWQEMGQQASKVPD